MLKVSTYRKEITPTEKFMPCYLCGHAIRTEKAEGIIDPLWVTSLVLDVDGTKIVWVSVELIGLEKAFTDKIRKMVSEKYDVDINLVNINYVHTHSAPEYSKRNIFGLDSCAVEGYPEFVEQ